MSADIPTLFLTAITSSLVLSAALGLVGSQKAMADLRPWALALLLHATGYALFALRGSVPLPVSVIGANTAIALFVALWLVSFAGVTPSRWLVYLPVAIVAVGCASIDDLPTRSMLVSTVLVFQEASLIALVLKCSRAEPGGWQRPGPLLMIVALGINLTITLVRLIALLAGVENAGGLTTRGTFQTLIFLTGTLTPMLVSIGFMMLLWDRARLRIEEQRQTLQAVFDNTEETIGMVDAGGHLLTINRAGAARFGTTPERLHHRHFNDFLPPDVATRRLALLARTFAEGRRQTIEDDRAGHHYQLSFNPIPGKTDRAVVFATDITERKRHDIEIARRMEELTALNTTLAATREQLLHAEKRAALGRLAAGLAHEINNPVSFVQSNLGSLQGYVDDLLEITDACAQAIAASNSAECTRIAALKAENDYDYIRSDIPALLTQSRQGLERVHRVVLDLLDFACEGRAEWDWADLHHGLEVTLGVLGGRVSAKASVVRRYAATLPQVYCQPAQIHQVFMDLLQNAAQAIAEHGTITITTAQPDSQHVRITIADTGVGIPADHLAHIFDPFFTTRPVGSGQGLGLAAAYGIVTAHVGTLVCRSEPGTGSEFEITLPLEAATPHPEENPT
jgi:two-component system NtrC family sensor kinase